MTTIRHKVTTTIHPSNTVYLGGGRVNMFSITTHLAAPHESMCTFLTAIGFTVESDERTAVECHPLTLVPVEEPIAELASQNRAVMDAFTESVPEQERARALAAHAAIVAAATMAKVV